MVGSVVNLSLYDLRNRFYRNAVHLDLNQFGEQGSSELMSRFTNDTEMLGAGLKMLFGKMIAEPLRAVSCIVLACWINWQLTLLFLVLVPIAILVLTKVGRIMKRATRDFWSACRACTRFSRRRFRASVWSRLSPRNLMSGAVFARPRWTSITKPCRW